MSAKKLFCLIILTVFVLPISTFAQSQIRTIEINSIDTSSFPEVDVLIRALDLNGVPIPNLGISDFEITEDDVRVSNPRLDTQEEAIAVYFIIDAGSTLINTDADPRWTRAKDVITEFAINRPIMRNDQDIVNVQIVQPDGVVSVASDSTQGSEVRAALESFDFNQAASDEFADVIPVVDDALEALSSGSQYDGLAKFVVVMSGDLQITKQAQIDQVIQKSERFQVPIHSVLLKPNPAPFSESLRSLSQEARGLFVPYQDAGSVSPIFEQFEKFRQQYLLTYDSISGVSGTRLVQVNGDAGSDRANYEIEIGPPRILINEPVDGAFIDRTAEAFTDQLDTIEPSTISVKANVTTTPPRRLASAKLLVNGNVVDSTTTPGRELDFNWDLRRDQKVGTTAYKLEIVVEDILGLTGTSPVVNVDVRLVVPPQPTAAPAPVGPVPTPNPIECVTPADALDGRICEIERSIRSNPLSITAIVLSLLAIIAAFYIGLSRSDRAESIRTTLSDVSARLTQQFRQQQAKAYLIAVEGEGVNLERQLPIYGTTPIGSSSEHAQLLFHQNKKQSPISRLHCTILDDEVDFILRDEDSANGTYVNGKMVDHQVRLNDGDSIELALVEQGGVKLIFQIEGDDFEVLRETEPDAMGGSMPIEGETRLDIDDMLEESYNTLWEDEETDYSDDPDDDVSDDRF